MLAFFLKKNFCDGWDNLFLILISNLVTIALLAALALFVQATAHIALLAVFVALVLSCGVLMSVVFAWGAVARKIADFNTPSLALFFRSLKESWRTGFLFGLLLGAFLLFVLVATRFYLGMAFSGKTVGVFFTLLVLVFALVCVAAVQWFVPLYFLQEENTFGKCLKKSFIIFFDNAAFSFALLCYDVLLLVLSLFLFFLLPGIHGITLATTNALRLRLYKYDWLDEHPDFLTDRDKRAAVPWDDLLAADKETLGDRKLLSFIFPWK